MSLATRNRNTVLNVTAVGRYYTGYPVTFGKYQVFCTVSENTAGKLPLKEAVFYRVLPVFPGILEGYRTRVKG